MTENSPAAGLFPDVPNSESGVDESIPLPELDSEDWNQVGIEDLEAGHGR